MERLYRGQSRKKGTEARLALGILGFVAVAVAAYAAWQRSLGYSGLDASGIPGLTSLTTLGSLVWNSGFVVAGYLLGANWQVVDEYAGIFQKVVIGAIAVVVDPAGHPVGMYSRTPLAPSGR